MINYDKICLPSGSVKAFLCLLFFSATFFCSGQYFNIYYPVRDSVAANSYHYHVNGIANFPDSSVVHAELITNEVPPVMLTEGISLPSDPGSTSLSEFVYDPVTGLFSFDLGNFPTTDMYLHMWVVVGGMIENEIYYKQ
jgi:hypothetical protein